MDWNDLQYALVVSRTGSLLGAAKELRVAHTTVGRRIEALEEALGTQLFLRTRKGMVLTSEAGLLLPELTRVDATIHAIQRAASVGQARIEGTVRVTSGETFASCYLAPRLARFSASNPGLCIELVAGGEVLDLSRRQADIAVRMFRSEHQSLVVRRVGTHAYGLYAHPDYLCKHPIRKPSDLQRAVLLSSEGGDGVVEAEWVRKLTSGATPALVSNLSIGLAEAARQGHGIAVLPRYLGDADPSLCHIEAPQAPSEPIWLTVHEDARKAPRVRAVLQHLAACFKEDAAKLAGRA